ncbi:DUF998 domain-containing protein [Algoriphagus sp. C2-6-M1]|uniref:DUF998 domain-containing protein n=1 Tax=Algoriphagus persicinus TaxID=3108754 RepID=UPI002B37CAAA|nr:DUF998 domain-containing protein [Algoriphagus sp. C2-6-M1]MEB2781482.1 DUF998 domain-containing protein [Algoriphagus sp. C2-6-M1]
MNQTSLRYLALGGIIGPILFTVVIIITASLRRDYNHVSNFISELGAIGTPNAVLMNVAGFLPFGLLIAALGLSLLLLLPKGKGLRIGSFLVFVFGLGVILAGLFSCDAGCPQEGSSANMIHHGVSAIAFLSAIVGSGILGFSFRNLSDWRPLWLFSVINCVISLGFLFAMINSFEAYTHTGIWQRLLLLTLFIWFGTVGLRIYRLAKE